jgi:hypothetical protein
MLQTRTLQDAEYLRERGDGKLCKDCAEGNGAATFAGQRS